MKTSDIFSAASIVASTPNILNGVSYGSITSASSCNSLSCKYEHDLYTKTFAASATGIMSVLSTFTLSSASLLIFAPFAAPFKYSSKSSSLGLLNGTL